MARRCDAFFRRKYNAVGLLLCPCGACFNVRMEQRGARCRGNAPGRSSQPYWLREEGTAGMFRGDDPSLIGRPENPAAFPVEQIFEVIALIDMLPADEIEALAEATTALGHLRDVDEEERDPGTRWVGGRPTEADHRPAAAGRARS